MAPLRFISDDLAPGDSKSSTLDISMIEVTRVESRGDPLFEEAYARMWEQFGASNELEPREVLGRRLEWMPGRPRAGFAMQYDLILMRSRGMFVAVRDHTAIADARGAVVHLSHALVAPHWRRTGIAGWLRAFPIQTARACLSAAGADAAVPITLAAEMEYATGESDAKMVRLLAYERAGYRKIDPAVVDYHQPDFRAPALIDATGGPAPLRFQLVVRRPGRESEETISGAEVRAIVERLYCMYGQEFRATDMKAVWKMLDHFPPANARLALLPPSAPV